MEAAVNYQQSFRIDDLLTRKVPDQQPDHFSTTLASPPLPGAIEENGAIREPLAYSSMQQQHGENKVYNYGGIM